MTILQLLILAFQAVSTAFIAAFVAYIAWRQWLTAHQKFSLDLFNKRFEAFDYINAHFQPANIFKSPDYVHGKRYVDEEKVERSIREAKFLFDDEIYNELNEAYFMKDKYKAIEKAAIACERMEDTLRIKIGIEEPPIWSELKRFLGRDKSPARKNT